MPGRPQRCGRFYIQGGLTPEPLRELAERFLLGEIQYSIPEGSGRPNAGQVLPEFGAIGILDGVSRSIGELAPPGSLVLFFGGQLHVVRFDGCTFFPFLIHDFTARNQRAFPG